MAIKVTEKIDEERKKDFPYLAKSNHNPTIYLVLGDHPNKIDVVECLGLKGHFTNKIVSLQRDVLSYYRGQVTISNQ